MRYRRKSDGFEIDMQQISHFGYRYIIESGNHNVTNYIDKSKLDNEWEKLKDDNVIRRGDAT